MKEQYEPIKTLGIMFNEDLRVYKTSKFGKHSQTRIGKPHQ